MTKPAFRRPRSSGFTLVEVMIAMTILGIITSVALALYIQGSKHFARTTTDLDAEREARAAMGYTVSELRQAMPRFGVQNDVPVVSPTAPAIPIPSPTPTSQVVFWKVDSIANAVSGTTINTGALAYDKVVIEPDPLASSAPDNLMEFVSDASGKLLSSRIIGRDVETFAVTPIRADSYDIKITTAPNIRKDMLDPANPSLYTYTLSSTVFISYYPTNSQ
jgi:prepilin-type N-terminal cleavage/methylation domain-containing protein